MSDAGNGWESGVETVEPTSDPVNTLALTLVKEYGLALLGVTITFILLSALCCCFCSRLGKRSVVCRGKKKKDESEAEKACMNEEATDGSKPGEVTSQFNFIRKTAPTTENRSNRNKRKRAETRSIIDMLDTAQWLRNILQEGGVLPDDETMIEIRTLMRRLRELKNYSCTSEDESDLELSYIMQTPISKTAPSSVMHYPVQTSPPPPPPQPSQYRSTPDDIVVLTSYSDIPRVKEILDINSQMAELSEKVTSFRPELMIQRSVPSRGSENQTANRHSSFSQSSLQCFESSPVTPDSSFEVPMAMTNNLRSILRENSGTFGKKNIAGKPVNPPVLPRGADSFNRTQLLKNEIQAKLAGNSKQAVKRQVSFKTSPAIPEQEFDTVDYPASSKSTPGFAPLHLETQEMLLSLDAKLNERAQHTIESRPLPPPPEALRSPREKELDLLGEQIEEFLKWSAADAP